MSPISSTAAKRCRFREERSGSSPKVATYDLKPEMSAWGVTERVLAEIKSDRFDVIVMNYANCDMVGHTGSSPAAIKAVETVDACLAQVVPAILNGAGR